MLTAFSYLQRRTRSIPRPELSQHLPFAKTHRPESSRQFAPAGRQAKVQLHKTQFVQDSQKIYLRLSRHELLVPIGQDIQCPTAQTGPGQGIQYPAAQAVLAPAPPKNPPAREQQAVRPSGQIGQSPAPQNSIYIGFAKNILTAFTSRTSRTYRVGHIVPHGPDRSRVGRIVPRGPDRSRVGRVVPSGPSRLSTCPSQEPTSQGAVGSSPQRADRPKSSSTKLNLYRFRKKYAHGFYGFFRTYRVRVIVPHSLDRSKVGRIVPSGTNRLDTCLSQEPTGQGAIGSSPQRADRPKSSSTKLNLYRICKKYTHELLVPTGQDIQYPTAQTGPGQSIQCPAAQIGPRQDVQYPAARAVLAQAILAPAPPKNPLAREQQAVRPSGQIG